MPFKSDKQRRFIHAKADEGKKWAKKFIRDAKKNDGPNAPEGLKDTDVSGGPGAVRMYNKQKGSK